MNAIIRTPEPGEPNRRVRFFDGSGKEITLFEAIGTTPSQTPTLNHFGVSGGKDSDALFLWALYESGYDRKSLVVSMSDTENEDQVTYDHVDIMRQRHPIHTIKPPRGFWELAKHKGIFPTRRRRFCTEYLKMEPTRFFLHALSDAGFRVVVHSGVRAAESQERAELPERDLDGYFGLPVYRPLLAWSLEKVLAMHEKYDLPLNPLYSMGARRVGCFLCVNSVKAEIKMCSFSRPGKIETIGTWEDTLTQQTGQAKTFFHRKTVPPRFRTVPFTTKDGEHIKVCNIADVVRWARTGHRCKMDDGQMDLAEGFTSCIAAYGACE